MPPSYTVEMIPVGIVEIVDADEHRTLRYRLIMETPATLYHGSPSKIDGALQPVHLPPDEDRIHPGPAVFATAHKGLASQFMLSPDILSSFGYEQDIPFVCVWGTPEEALAKDTGGYLYELPSETFAKIGKEYEWISDVAVTPTHITHYPSALRGMHENGVRIYFITDDGLFDRIQRDKMHRLETLNEITPWEG